MLAEWTEDTGQDQPRRHGDTEKIKYFSLVLRVSVLDLVPCSPLTPSCIIYSPSVLRYSRFLRALSSGEPSDGSTSCSTTIQSP